MPSAATIAVDVPRRQVTSGNVAAAGRERVKRAGWLKLANTLSDQCAPTNALNNSIPLLTKTARL